MKDLLYIGGGIVAGWAIGKMLFGDGRIQPNASKPKRPDDPGGATAQDLVSALPSFDPDDPNSVDPINRVSIPATGIPEFAEGASLWSTASSSRFLLMLGALPIGVIESTNGKFSARAFVGDKQVKIVEKATRKNAIGSAYTAAILLEYLSRRRGSIDRAQDIADTLGIPLSFVTKAGERLAKAGFIFGVSERVYVEPTVRQERLIVPGAMPLSSDPAVRKRQLKELKRAKRRRRAGKEPKKIEHKRRRVVEHPDVAKLRKSPALTKEERKALPKGKTVTRFALGLFGPGKILGLYEDLTAEEQRQLKIDLKKRAAEEEAAVKAEMALAAEKLSGEIAIDKDSPYYAPQDEALRKLFTDPEDVPSAAFFEDKRLEALDWLNRQRDEQYQARKIDALTKRIEQLRDELDAATERKEAAEAAGDGNRMIRAVSEQMKIRSELDKMLEKLARAQKALHGK